MRNNRILNDILFDGDDSVENPLHRVCRSYRATKDVVVALLEGDNPNVDVNGPTRGTLVTPLMIACSDQSRSEIVRTLIARGANVSLTDARGWTALHHACHMTRSNHRNVRRLLEAGSDANAAASANEGGVTPVAVAVRCATSLRVFDTLVEHGANVHARFRGPSAPWDFTLLHSAAALAGDSGFSLVTRLLFLNVDVHASAADNTTPLFHAVKSGNATVATALLDAGARVDVTSASGERLIDSIHYRMGRAGIVKRLQELFRAERRPYVRRAAWRTSLERAYRTLLLTCRETRDSSAPPSLPIGDAHGSMFEIVSRTLPQSG